MCGCLSRLHGQTASRSSAPRQPGGGRGEWPTGMVIAMASNGLDLAPFAPATHNQSRPARTQTQIRRSDCERESRAR